MATDAEKIVMYREKAKDTSIPQEVRNTYLDRANELERKVYEASKAATPSAPEKKLAKGGMASKYMSYSKTGKPAGMKPVTKMATGGMMINQGVGASMKPHDVFGTKGKM